MQVFFQLMFSYIVKALCEKIPNCLYRQQQNQNNGKNHVKMYGFILLTDTKIFLEGILDLPFSF